MDIRIEMGSILVAIGLVSAAALFCGAWWFNQRIDEWQRAGRVDEGYVWAEVVAGVAGTVTVCLPFWSVWLGWETSLMVWLSLLVAFTSSGLPMIRGDIIRNMRRKLNERQQARNEVDGVNRSRVAQ